MKIKDELWMIAAAQITIVSSEIFRTFKCWMYDRNIE